MHHEQCKGKVEAFFGLFHNDRHQKGPHHGVAQKHCQTIRPSTGVEYLEVVVGEHAVDANGRPVQKVIDLKKETQKQVVKTLHGHDLGNDQAWIKGLHAGLSQARYIVVAPCSGHCWN